MDEPFNGLRAALDIPGARSVFLVDEVEGVLCWSTGTIVLTDQDVLPASRLMRAAAELVTVTDPNEQCGDVLLTTDSRYYVLRNVETAHGKKYAACIILDRGQGHLAAARLEFRNLTAPLASAAREPARSPQKPANPELEIAPAVSSPLPHRRPVESSNQQRRQLRADFPAPSWTSIIGRPYENDESTLERILEALKLR